jgi:hypothetical protein
MKRTWPLKLDCLLTSIDQGEARRVVGLQLGRWARIVCSSFSSLEIGWKTRVRRLERGEESERGRRRERGHIP